jgi:hypothetical protein
VEGDLSDRMARLESEIATLTKLIKRLQNGRAYPPFHAARVFAENVARVTDTVVPFGPAKVSTWAPS